MRRWLVRSGLRGSSLSASDRLIDLVRSGSSDALLALASALEHGQIDLDCSPVGLASIQGVPDELATKAFESFAAVQGELTASAVATAIRTAVGIRAEERLDRPAVEVCWTGPDAEGALVTPNAAAVQRLLTECRDVGEILLVGYSLSAPKGSFMQDVVALLSRASRRKAKVQVVLHRDESDSRAQLMAHWDVFARKPQIYTWAPPPEHPYTKLHAKCLVVDRLQMLVTSANFTFHGLESNIELGLLVRSQPLASAVHDRFDHLIRTNILRLWDSD